MPKKEKKGPVVYVLELVGDVVNTGCSVTLETGEASLDRGALEPFRVKREKELDEYFGEGEEGEDEEDRDYCYHNSDLSGRPEWFISEIPLVK